MSSNKLVVAVVANSIKTLREKAQNSSTSTNIFEVFIEHKFFPHLVAFKSQRLQQDFNGSWIFFSQPLYLVKCGLGLQKQKTVFVRSTLAGGSIMKPIQTESSPPDKRAWQKFSASSMANPLKPAGCMHNTKLAHRSKNDCSLRR